MAVRDAVAGDLDALDALAGQMVTSGWRCDPGASARPTRAQIQSWIAGEHGRHVFVIDTLGNINGGMVHQGPVGKWWIIEKAAGFLVRLVQLCQAIWDAHGDCYGYVANPTARTDLLPDSRFAVSGNLVRYHP